MIRYKQKRDECVLAVVCAAFNKPYPLMSKIIEKYTLGWHCAGYYQKITNREHILKQYFPELQYTSKILKNNPLEVRRWKALGYKNIKLPRKDCFIVIAGYGCGHIMLYKDGEFYDPSNPKFKDCLYVFKKYKEKGFTHYNYIPLTEVMTDDN